MSESTTSAQTSDDLWNKARDAGLFSTTQGTNAFDLAIDRFAAAVRASVPAVKDGGPAFPVADPMQLQPANVQEMKRLAEGMSLREYFAVRAPQEIPDWFKGPALRAIRLPVPDAAIAEEAAEWNRDPCYDLDGVFDDGERQRLAREYSDAMDKYGTEIVAAQAEMEADRYFAWRWHYADMLLAARGAA